MLLFACRTLLAQEYSVDLHYWGTKEGLSDRQVNYICQDKQGLIWIATKNGLNRFDGYTFKVFNKASGHLPFDNLTYLAVDVSGNIWIQGQRDQKNNVAIFNPLTGHCQSLKEKTGYKENVQTLIMRNVGDSSLVFYSQVENILYTWHPRHGIKKASIPVQVRKFICVSDSGTLWVEGLGQTLYDISIDGVVRKVIKVPFVAEDKYPYIPGKGIFIKDSITWGMFHISPSMEVTDTKGIIPPHITGFRDYAFHTGIDNIVWRQGKLYNATGGVLKDFLQEGTLDLRTYFRMVYVERNGNIWMGNDVGLYLLNVRKSKFRQYFYEEEKTVLHNSYRNILIKDRHLYSCNEFKGVRCISLDSNARPCPRLRDADATKGYVLLNTNDNRILGIQGQNTFTISNVHNLSVRKMPATFKYHQCWSAMWTTNDSLLLGTNTGLEWYSITHNTHTPYLDYGPCPELAKSHVTGFLKDNSGQWWIVSTTGLYTYDIHRGVTNRFSESDTGSNYLPAKEFQYLYQDTQGVYWLGATNGLIRWEKSKGTYELFTRKQGLSNNNIYAIYEDNHQRLWLSSDYGIMQFDKATHLVRAFSTADGITHNEFNRVSHFRDSAGNIYFGSMNGITGFNPEDFPVNDSANTRPKLIVTSFEQFDGDVNKIINKTPALLQNNDITLKPGDRFFTLNFALLNYTDVIHNTYYWRMDGVDTTWNATREPSLRISGLPYGDHRLRLRAQSSDGSWGGNDLVFSVHVIKPFYLKGWFIGLCVLVLGSSFAGWFRWRVYRLKTENERLDKIVQDKTIALEETIKDLKISTAQKDVLMKEIHHRVKNNIQVISSLLKMELANVQDERARRSIEEGILRISSIGLIHQHLYKGEDLTCIQFGDFVTELNKQVASIYQQRGQTVNFQINIPEVSLEIDTALPLGLILNELMTNSYKYTYTTGRENRMEINLGTDADMYVLQFRDFGSGLPEDHEKANSGSLGMLIINGLAKQLGGYFKYNRADNTFIVAFKDTLERKKSA